MDFTRAKMRSAFVKFEMEASVQEEMIAKNENSQIKPHHPDSDKNTKRSESSTKKKASVRG